jgi:hypothetical protein
MVQDLVWFLFLEAVVGFALSVVVAAILSQLGRNLTISGASAGLLLLGAPAYLAVDYAIDQGAASIAFLATGFVFGLYRLRDWWASAHFTRLVGSRVWAAMRPVPLRPAIRPADALRGRMLSVVRADRRLQRRTSDQPFADAA